MLTLQAKKKYTGCSQLVYTTTVNVTLNEILMDEG
jgi:hypothetical protein